MEFYIAARFDRKEEVRALYKELQARGHKISADWTLHEPIKPYESNQELARQYAFEDIEGARRCGVFVILYVIGDYASRSPFYFHPSVSRRKTFDDVLEEIEKG
ncbi:hypothetical protein HZC32_00410 [Candidatus Woesearchaeota archaeon]|nr:hypothetical protein [Candidatus Woesearchaeota archaeon]